MPGARLISPRDRRLAVGLVGVPSRNAGRADLGAVHAEARAEAPSPGDAARPCASPPSVPGRPARNCRRSVAPPSPSSRRSVWPPRDGVTSMRRPREASTPTSPLARPTTTRWDTCTQSTAETVPTPRPRPGQTGVADYATEPGRRPRLVGVMFSVARGVSGPTPGGRSTRWHSHIVCVRGIKRGLTPRPDGTCPRGRRRRRRGARCSISGSRETCGAHSPCTPRCRSSVATGCSRRRPAGPGHIAAKCEDLATPIVRGPRKWARLV